MRWIKRALLVLVLFLLCALWQWPMHTVLPKLSPSNVQWQNVEGRIWRGQAQAVQISLADQTITVQNLSWRWRLTGLLSGKMQWHVDVQDRGLRVSGMVGMGLNRVLTLQDTQFAIDAARLNTIANNPWVTFGLGGTVSELRYPLQSDTPVLPSVQANIRLTESEVLPGRSQLNEPFLLGDVDIKLNDDVIDDALPLTWQSAPDAAVQMNGEANLLEQGNYTVSVNIADPKTLPEIWQQGGQLFAAAQDDGSWQFEYAGLWR